MEVTKSLNFDYPFGTKRKYTRPGDILAHYFRIFGQTVGHTDCNKFG